MNRLEVRRVTEEDWSDWRTLRLRALAEAPDAFGSRLDQVDDRETSWRVRIAATEACFLCFDGDTPVGMVAADPSTADSTTGGPTTDDPATDNLVLQSMFVAPAVRGRGIGRALIDAVVAHAAGRPVVLGVMPGNTAAIGAYERAGFVHDDSVAGIACEVTMRFVPSPEESPHAR